MRKPASMWSLETLGRVRLSPYFFMREFLYSEIGNFHRIQNIPDDPDTAIKAGRALCHHLLDPLVETFGIVSIRSAYRAPELNRFGNENNLNCARNDYNWGRRIWDRPDAEGRLGACATVVIPWFADHYAAGRDWRDLAGWLHHHLPFHDAWFFPKLCAFNITWREAPEHRVFSYIAPKGEWHGPGDPATWADFPAFRALDLPKGPSGPLPDSEAKPPKTPPCP